MKILASYHSSCLLRTVNYLLWLPDKGVTNSTRTIVFLHGVEDNYEDWVNNTRVISLFRNTDTALVFPDGQNSFYVNYHESRRFADYVGSELPDHLHKVYGLPGGREKWALCGYSMGGYGALHTGLMFPQNYERVSAFSSALVVDRAVNSSEDAPFIIERRSFFESVFGDLDKLRGSENDLEELVRRNRDTFDTKMVLKCGTEDFLLDVNRAFHAFLKDEGIVHSYEEFAGTHDWDFWNQALEKTKDFLLGSEELR